MGVSVYIDADVIVSSCEHLKKSNQKESIRFMELVLKDKNKEKFSFFTSQYTLLEIASAIGRRTKNKDLAYSELYKIIHPMGEYITILQPSKRKKIDFKKYITQLIEISVKHSTPAGDTIHAQIIEDYEIDILVTWNIDHYKCFEENISRLKLMKPNSFLDKYNKI